ncbi:MAG: rod shape-determining protein, partial [Candidatus Dormiibacterota bacterium]
MAGRRFAVDLSPDRILVWVRGDGLIVDEPALAAWSESARKVTAFGDLAARQLAEGKEGVVEVHPLGLRELGDPEAAGQLVRQLTARVVGRITFARHELVLAVPSCLSTAARRVLLDAALASGARMAHLLDVPVAMGFGAGLPVTSWDPSPVLYLIPQGAQAGIVCHHGLLADGSLELALPTGPPAEAEVERVRELVEEVFASAPLGSRPRLQAAGLSLAGRGVELE